jgi:hypothetical protein
MPLAKYAADNHATVLVTQAVEQIQRFLDDEDAALGTPTVAGELEAADRSLSEGRVWDGLASLRRAIEVELRDLASREGIAGNRKGAGQILADLQRREVIPSDLARALRYVIDVANRGVHGEPVDPSQADEALFMTKRALDALRGTAQ